MEQHFVNTPHDIPGNDDTGAMSSCLVFSMMDIYPITPRDMNFAITFPSFEEISISLNQDYYKGKLFKFTIYFRFNPYSLSGKELNLKTIL
ncbi:hypothetical protein CJF42_19575 [Pseudoalteromonas sp. NBT06-2]|uniref:glycoside hydrolase domain-containing protein n=1 Tax=Pseudoalteromonas sp. NBT06-2 TaxID=2025950 RepID=UPI000BA5E2DC|nr:hypothetical protein CJF42_19575 [Pseudoalteromonas sp. NBT06-2]